MRNGIFWILFMTAGIIMIILLSLHMGLMHLGGFLGLFGVDLEDVRSFAAVLERGKSASYLAFYIAFLALALYHGLYGLRTIIFELTIPKTLESLVTIILILVGGAAFAYGTYTIIMAFAR